MGTVIGLTAYKTKKQLQSFGDMIYNVFTMFFDMMLHYVVYPSMAATLTVARKKPIIL